MSTISSGITAGTALAYTGDTTGTLQLQINGTTPAVTLNTSGAIGVGVTPGYGLAGQVLTSAGTASAPTWSTVNPQSGAAKTTSYALLASDNGKLINLGASGAVTIPNSTFAAGDVVSVYNDTASGATITCSIGTAYIAGVNTTKSSVILATRGVCTITFITSILCIITGNVS